MSHWTFKQWVLLAQTFPWVACIFLSIARGAPAPASTRLQWNVSPLRSVGFQRLSNDLTGLTFTHVVPAARSMTNQLLLDGAGVALADVDGDGRVDVFLASSTGGSQLWKNLGDWRFQEITTQAFPERGVDLGGDVTGVVLVDLNGDRSPDLILNTHAEGLRILLNDGHGVFHRLKFSQNGARGGHSVAVADVDGDGWLDIYVCNYRQRALMDMPSARATFRTTKGVTTVATLDGRPTTEPDLTNRFVVTAMGGLDELGEPDVLYRNQHGTNFVEVSWTEGAFRDESGQLLSAPPRDWGLSAQFCDVNDDGRPDLYVCNDFQAPDRLWLNESTPGTVRFRLAPAPTLRHTSLFSMGVDFADVNRDLRWDFATLDMLSPDPVRRLTSMDGVPSAGNNPGDWSSRPQYGANSLFVQGANGTFAEVGNFAGVSATDWSWALVFMDVDLDGWPDLLVSAGQARASRDLDLAERMKEFRRGGLRTDAQIFRERQKFPPHFAPLRAFRNRGMSDPGQMPAFEEVSKAWGFDFLGVSHGMALADLDGDGDLDVVVNQLHAPAGLYRNESTASRISVELKGKFPNTSAIGASLRFWWAAQGSSNSLPQSAQVTAGGRYLSSDALSKTFACPGVGRGRLEVRWPGGSVSTFADLAANQRYALEEPGRGESAGNAAWTPPQAVSRLSFEAVVFAHAWTHGMADEFDLQPTLPRRWLAGAPVLAVSRKGPDVTTLWSAGGDSPVQWVDYGPTQTNPIRNTGSLREITCMVPWGGQLLVAGRGVTPGNSTQASLFLLDGATGAQSLIHASVGSTRCLAVSTDAPAKGAHVFVGGGALPGKYPEADVSQWLEFDGNEFQTRVTTPLGLVTAARFVRWTAQDQEELAVLSDWGCPQIFRPEGIHLTPREMRVRFGDNPPGRLGDLKGWWQSLAAGDFDGDGRTDLVLGNWGLNSSFAPYTGRPSDGEQRIRPLLLFHGPNGSGVTWCGEACTEADGRRLPINGLADWARHAPWVSAAFPTYRSFATATIEEILGDRLKTLQRLECHFLSSLILLNRGDSFEARALPDLAQLGPLLSLAVGDFDDDGHLDLFGAQGYSGHNYGRAREDAGTGVFMLGMGDGRFHAQSLGDAGVQLPGEQRSVVVGDFNGDRRTDLAIGERGGALTLLFNRSAARP